MRISTISGLLFIASFGFVDIPAAVASLGADNVNMVVVAAAPMMDIMDLRFIAVGPLVVERCRLG